MLFLAFSFVLAAILGPFVPVIAGATYGFRLGGRTREYLVDRITEVQVPAIFVGVVSWMSLRWVGVDPWESAAWGAFTTVAVIVVYEIRSWKHQDPMLRIL